MRCFRRASLYSFSSTHLIHAQKHVGSAHIAASQPISGGYCGCVDGCERFRCSCHRYTPGSTRASARQCASAVFASEVHLSSTRTFYCTQKRAFTKSRTPSTVATYPSSTSDGAHRGEDPPSSSLATPPVPRTSSYTSPAKSNCCEKSFGVPPPSKPRRAARHVVLRADATTPPQKPMTVPSSQSASTVRQCEDRAPIMAFSYREKLDVALNENGSSSTAMRSGVTDHRNSRETQQQQQQGPREHAMQFQGTHHQSPPFSQGGGGAYRQPPPPQEQRQQQRQKSWQPKSKLPPKPFSVSRDHHVEPGNIPGGDLANARGVSALMADTHAEVRVLAMLHSDQRRANPGCVLSLSEPQLFNVPHSTLKRSVLRLRLPGVQQEVLAIGQSTKAKLSRTLCFMHAEQLLDFFASEDVSVQVNAASPPSSLTTLPPPPLEEKKVEAAMTVPKERDFHSWDEYVDASERYVQDTAAKAQAEALAQEQIPRSGHPVADRAAELLRRNRRQYCHPQALQELNESLRDGTQLMRTAHLASKVFVATLQLDPKTGLTATGVAKNSKDARRECAAHALCILKLLQHDAEGRPQDAPLAAAATVRGKKLAGPGGQMERSNKASKGGKKGANNASANDDEADAATRPGAALDAVLQQLQPSHGKLLRFFRLLFGKDELAPTMTFTRAKADNCSTVYRCQLTMGDIVCTGTGVNRFEAERSAMDNGVTELLLYDARLQAVQTFIDAFPSIAPESIPSAALPCGLVERLRQQLRPVTQRQLAHSQAKRAAEPVTEEGSSKSLNREEQALLRLSERAFAADPLYSARMQEALRALHQHPAYLADFHPRRSTLAMAQVRLRVLDAVQHHRVTVVCGTTGCGKTTQVPQYILDHEIEQGRGGSCNILVTQPRRLSSFSVADRIAHERLSVVGKDVGYAVRLDARPGRHITVCTTGVLLQIFSTHPELEHVSHLIIDEVHERDINCDVILALVKQLLTRNPRLRVVLMSATMQSDMFAKYFGEDTPVIQVEGAVYPVSVRYLEDIAAEAATAGFYSPNFDVVPLEQSQGGEKEKNTDGASAAKQRTNTATSPRVLLRKPPKTDYNLIAYLVHRAVQVDLLNQTAGKSILVFLPGWKEMVSAKAAIEQYHGPFAATSPSVRFHLILLHSTVDSAKQRECFVPAPPGMVKVVLATNIAESGITIDDAAVVIDTGLIKTTTWAGRPGAAGSLATRSPTSLSSLFVPLDQLTRTPVNGAAGGSSSGSAGAAPTAATAATPTPVFSTQLKLEYASQANGTQRKGRAGRTQGGVCYRLYTKDMWDALPAFPEADIHRVPLTQVLLKLLSLGYDHPKETLQTFLEPPSLTNVAVSMQLLRDIGAVDEAERLTPLGEYLAKLPCDPRIGKMIIMGAVLRCLDSVLTVAACVDVSPYVTSREQAAAARKKRYLLARGSQSDHVSFLNAFNAYCANGESDAFAHFNLLHPGNLHIISKYKAQYRDILVQAGLISEQDVYSTAGRSGFHVPDSVEGDEVDLIDDDDDKDALFLSDGNEADTPAVCSNAATARRGEGATPTTTAANATDSMQRPYIGELCVDTSALSQYSFDVALVKACVCAALFPNVAVLRPPPSTGTLLQRRRRAEKVELRTKHFTSIKPSKDSACRRIGGPRDQGIPSRTELLDELHKGKNRYSNTDAGAALTIGSGSSPSTPSAPVPALFYMFQDVFGVKEARQEFLTTLSSVSLWALLLFGASESTTQYFPDLSLCVIDGWVAVQLDKSTYYFITELRQALYTCLHGKYHHPKDELNNTALRAVTDMCQAVLKAPVLAIGAAAADEQAGAAADAASAAKAEAEAAAATQASRLVDTGSIVDPLALVRRDGYGNAAADASALSDLASGEDDDDDDDGASPEYGGEDKEDEEGFAF